MRIRGIKYICDRCGETKFYELDSDGSFKEPCMFHLLDIKDDTHLCDECHNKLHRIIDEFMKENADDRC